jgi:hypothetical protein
MIPVEISLDGESNNRDLKPGMNAYVYIQRNGTLSAATKSVKQPTASKTGD